MNGLGEGRGDEGRDYAPAALAGVGRSIPKKMHPTAPPRGGQDAGGGRLDALVRIPDHQASRRDGPAAHETPQERRSGTSRPPDRPMAMPSTSRRPSVFTPTAMVTPTATATMRPT